MNEEKKLGIGKGIYYGVLCAGGILATYGFAENFKEPSFSMAVYRLPKAEESDSSSLPEKLRQFDLDRNGIIDSKEAKSLEESVIFR